MVDTSGTVTELHQETTTNVFNAIAVHPIGQ